MKKRRFTPELLEFIRQMAFGRSTQELAEMANERFGTDFTKDTMYYFLKNHKIRNGRQRKPAVHTEKYPRNVREYIQENYVGIGPKKMAQILNEKFGTNYEHKHIKAYYANHKLNSGLNGSEDRIPWLKGKKGYRMPGCEKNFYRKGNVPQNTVPVGTIRKCADGYLLKKVSDVRYAGKANWRQLHYIVWEEANGTIPEGKKIAFLDGNPENCALENLVLTDAAEIAVANKLQLRFDDPELTKAGLMVAKVTIAANERLNKYQGGNECSKISK
jgi:hypothetical protein